MMAYGNSCRHGMLPQNCPRCELIDGLKGAPRMAKPKKESEMDGRRVRGGRLEVEHDGKWYPVTKAVDKPGERVTRPVKVVMPKVESAKLAKSEELPADEKPLKAEQRTISGEVTFKDVPPAVAQALFPGVYREADRKAEAAFRRFVGGLTVAATALVVAVAIKRSMR